MFVAGSEQVNDIISAHLAVKSSSVLPIEHSLQALPITCITDREARGGYLGLEFQHCKYGSCMESEPCSWAPAHCAEAIHAHHSAQGYPPGRACQDAGRAPKAALQAI